MVIRGFSGRSANQGLPGPSSLSVLARLRQIQASPLAFLMEYTRRYGDLWGFTAGTQPVVFVNHPSLVKHILLDNAHNYSKDTFQYRQLARIAGKGLLTSDGEIWLTHRRLLQSAFHHSLHDELATTAFVLAHEMSNEFAQRNREVGEGKLVNIQPWMLHLAMRILGKTFFSMELGGASESLVHSIEIALDYILHSSFQFSLKQENKYAFEQALAEIDQFAHHLIITARQRKKKDSTSKDFLDILVAALEGEGTVSLTESEVRDEIVTLLIAGHETVATALTWTIYLLAAHVEVQEALRAELFNTLGGEQPPTYQKLSQLTLTRHVFEEALRLFPPAWLITRRAVQEDILGEHRVPANALVVISPYAVHRHPSFWAQPEHFDPSRFESALAKSRPRFAYIPFGAGPRLCIGNQVAVVESLAVIAALVQRFRFSLARASAVPQMKASVTLQPKEGMWLRIQSL